MIIIDSRERSKIPFLLKKYTNTKTLELSVGDYAIIGPKTSVCLSSKSAEDYISSIENGHLNEELIQMSANYEKCVLMVHGNIDRALMYRKLNRQTIYNYMAGVISRSSPYGLKATPSFVNFFTPDEKGWKKDPYNKSVYDAVQFLKSLNDIISTDKIERAPNTIKYKVPEGEERIYAIQYMFKPTKCIGKTRAKEIAKRFGSIREVANATPSHFREIDGIGKKISEQMYNLLNERI